MAFSAIAWAYKEEATSTKLQAMVDNIVAHDHRSDGTQGAALIGDWVDCTADVSPGSGFILDGVQRYRLLLGGVLVEWDFRAKRIGVDIVATPVTGSGPGAFTDTPVITGIPPEAAAGPGQGIATDWNNCFCYIQIQGSGDRLILASGGASSRVNQDSYGNMRAVLWRP